MRLWASSPSSRIRRNSSAPAAKASRLTPFRAKARLISELGTDVLFALAFDAEMAGKSAQEFVLDVLVDGLGIGCVVVGGDFQFGKGRAGNVTVLSYMGEMEGFGVEIFDAITAGGEKISSTQIREALKAGRPADAAKLLGHWWSVEGRVEHGEKRGRTIGVPTANMRLADCLYPAFGVYAVRATLYEDDHPVLTKARSPISASVRCSRSKCRCWKPGCSISTATSTASISRWSSGAICGRR